MDLEEFEVVHLHLDLTCLFNLFATSELGLQSWWAERYLTGYSFCDFSDLNCFNHALGVKLCKQ